MGEGYKMHKPILRALVIIALVAALTVAGQRWILEQNNRTVELVVDYSSLRQLLNTDPDVTAEMAEMLVALKQLGVNGIALNEWTIGEKIALGDSTFASIVASAIEPAQMLAEPAGFNPDVVQIIKAAGLQVIPRLEANHLLSLTCAEKLNGVNPSMFIINAPDLLKSQEQLDDLSLLLQKANIKIGLVEFTKIQGISKLANGAIAVRVHGISPGEMEVLSTERIVARYLRAVRERNVRVLYIRPFLGEGGWERSLALLTDLKMRLENNGYHIGQAEPFGQWQPSRLVLWVISIGIIAGALLLALYWLVLPSWLVYALIILGSGASVYCLWWRVFLGQQLFALLAAIVFPTLAMCQAISPNRRWVYLKATLVSLGGALLVVGILSGSEYLISLQQFRGVKLMHVAPIVLVFIMSILTPRLPLRSWQKIKQVVNGFYHSAIPVKYLIALAGVGLVGAVYLLRTDNFTLPIPQLEIAMREGLERLLLVRPRTKEMLLGHPALFLAAVSGKRHPILLSIAVIGQLSLVNTFTHIHTPLLVSLLRTLYGLIIGCVVGSILWMIYNRCQRR